MTLFANTGFRNPEFPPPPSGITSASNGRIPGLGYILFPNPSGFPSQPPPYITPTPNVTTTDPSVDSNATPRISLNEPTDTKEGTPSEDAKRRRELEAEEARKGEEDWVRSGGVLRDAKGRRDWARTLAIRDELKLREVEAQIMKRWNDYEIRWTQLLSKAKRGNDTPNPNKSLRFADIPWPIKENETSIQIGDLTVKRVEDFLLESLTVRSVKLTKKDRVRSSLLRWHPDKLGNVLQQVHPEDEETVRKGLGVVMECLQRMNTQVT